MRKFVLIFLIIPSILIAQNDVNEVVVIKSDKQIEELSKGINKVFKSIFPIEDGTEKFINIPCINCGI